MNWGSGFISLSDSNQVDLFLLWQKLICSTKNCYMYSNLKEKKKHGKSFVIWTPNLYLLAFFRFAKFNFCHINFCHNRRKGCCICWFSPWALLWLSLSKHHFQYTQGTFCHNGKKGFPFGFFWKIGKRFTHQIREKINSQHVHFSPGGKSGFLFFFVCVQ